MNFSVATKKWQKEVICSESPETHFGLNFDHLWQPFWSTFLGVGSGWGSKIHSCSECPETHLVLEFLKSDDILKIEKKFVTVHNCIRDFPEKGRQPQRWGHQPVLLANFPQKLHENEKIWTQKGDAPDSLMRTCVHAETLWQDKSVRSWDGATKNDK